MAYLFRETYLIILCFIIFIALGNAQKDDDLDDAKAERYVARHRGKGVSDAHLRKIYRDLKMSAEDVVEEYYNGRYWELNLPTKVVFDKKGRPRIVPTRGK